MVNGVGSNDEGVVFIGGEGFSVRPELREELIEQQQAAPRFGQTQTGSSIPTIPVPPSQPTIIPDIPPEQLPVSVSPEQALAAGAITQQQFEEATRPETLTATTREGVTFQRLSTEPIRPEENVVMIQTPGQEARIAPTGQIFVSEGGPRQVSFIVPAGSLEPEPTIGQRALDISRRIGENISLPTGILSEQRPSIVGETRRIQGVTETTGARINIVEGGITITPITETQRQEEQFIQRVADITGTLPDVSPVADTTALGAVTEISTSFASPSVIFGLQAEFGRAFVQAGINIVPATFVALERPGRIPQMAVQTIQELPRRAIIQPIGLAGELAFDLVVGIGAIRGASTIIRGLKAVKTRVAGVTTGRGFSPLPRPQFQPRTGVIDVTTGFEGGALKARGTIRVAAETVEPTIKPGQVAQRTVSGQRALPSPRQVPEVVRAFEIITKPDTKGLGFISEITTDTITTSGIGRATQRAGTGRFLSRPGKESTDLISGSLVEARATGQRTFISAGRTTPDISLTEVLGIRRQLTETGRAELTRFVQRGGQPLGKSEFQRFTRLETKFRGIGPTGTREVLRFEAFDVDISPRRAGRVSLDQFSRRGQLTDDILSTADRDVELVTRGPLRQAQRKILETIIPRTRPRPISVTERLVSRQIPTQRAVSVAPTTQAQQRQFISPLSKSLVGKIRERAETTARKIKQTTTQLSGISLLSNQVQGETVAQRQRTDELLGQKQTGVQAQKQLQRQMVRQRQALRTAEIVPAPEFLTQELPVRQPPRAFFGGGFPTGTSFLIRQQAAADIFDSGFIDIRDRRKRTRTPSLAGVILGGTEKEPAIDTGIGIRRLTEKQRRSII